MLFYTRCYDVAKGKINVYETDTNSMKLEKWLQFEIDPEAFICPCTSKFVCHCVFLRGKWWNQLRLCGIDKYIQGKSTL